MKAWVNRKMKPPFPNVPFSRPEDCSQWLIDKAPGSGQMAPPAGRKFKKVARVQKPADPEEKSAIVHYHGGDNPYGNPLSLALLNAAATEEQGNRIFHGLAKQGMARMFPRFERRIHVIPDEAIPKFGTNYMWNDPAPGRNPFMTWVRTVPGQRAYVYREWPGNYDIPGVGVPGPWALPHGKLGDGIAGPGQDSFGFGFTQLKKEIARLEGWKDAEQPKPENQSETEWVRGWSNENGTRELVARKFIDSRAASAPHLEDDRPVTLLEDYAKHGLYFELTPGDDINEGVGLLNDRLSYDPLRPVDGMNCPRLFIAASCVNTIFALLTWRNKEGRKGATKDPIDNLRYFVLQGVEYMAPEDYASTGGGHY